MLRWKVWEDELPRQVECETYGYPNLDAEGHQQFTNTHFDDPTEAWDRALAEAEAWVHLSRRDVTRAQASLERALQSLSRGEEHLRVVRAAFEAAGLNKETR